MICSIGVDVRQKTNKLKNYFPEKVYAENLSIIRINYFGDAGLLEACKVLQIGIVDATFCII